MAEDNTQRRQTAELDLGDPAAYTSSVDWIRDNVVLKEARKGSVLQLDVALPNGSITLYMAPRDHYIMGFRGADKIYLLDDDQSEAWKEALEAQLPDAEVEIVKGLGAGHGAQGLGTFTRQSNSAGVRASVFSKEDLNSAVTLSTYSRKSGIHHEQLKRPLSLLVCMISESARIPMMQRDFRNMYYGHKVVADEAVRSYDDAKYLIQFARRAYHEYPPHLGVEKLRKRAGDLDDVVAKIESVVHSSDRQALLRDLLKGKTPSNAEAAAEWIKRFRDFCGELGIKEPGEATQLISTCKSESAVRAAKQGVIYPDIGKSTSKS